MSEESRRQVAQTQDQLVSALMANGPAPPRFDSVQLRSTAHSLLTKRYRQVQLAWPGFIDALGTQAVDLFAEFSRQSPLGLEAQGWRDGHRFARWLLSNNRLPDACRIILMTAELHGIEHPRRGIALHLGWLKEKKQPVFGVKLPGCAPWIIPHQVRLP